ncbi:hypothetical protein RclHR1_17510002 [Rhizophagus clarus]|uniref:Uncharacterized protein n=1 Tax=Rhizophagus clarus TaxID=94130 RepID=A0A2Z6QK78_9GLOM|nr:hypothetical protein RclHR1_17510002 [Rhizophagus clarus]
MMGVELENIFKKADTLEEICAAANKNEDLKNGLHNCILNVQHNHEINNFFKIILEINKSLNASEITVEILSKKRIFKNFLNHTAEFVIIHFKLKNVIMLIAIFVNQFGFLNTFLKICFLPDPIPSKCKSNTDCYEEFKTVYNIETTEKFRSTLIAAMENTERASPSILTNTKVRDIIQYFQCGKF